jgi:hypothetical protein
MSRYCCITALVQPILYRPGCRLRQQQVMHRALNAIAFRLVLRARAQRKRGQRRAVAAGRGDGLCGRKNVVHQRRLSRLQPAALTARGQHQALPYSSR